MQLQIPSRIGEHCFSGQLDRNSGDRLSPPDDLETLCESKSRDKSDIVSCAQLPCMQRPNT